MCALCQYALTLVASGPRRLRILEEHALHDFPIQGPRATHWLLLEIARSELGPVARHHWWKQAMGLSSSDPGVDERLFLCEMEGHRTEYDQLNLPDLALVEAASRRLQLWKNAMLRSYVRPRLAVSLRDMPRNDISFWADLDQRGAWWSPQSWTNGLPHNLPKRRPSLRKGVKEREER